MDCEQVWISDTSESNRLYKLGYIDSKDEFEYYSKDDDETINNFISLTYVNIPTIMSVLEKRYNIDKIYTFNGDILISINPFKKVNIYNDLFDEKRPHVYTICNKMYSQIHNKNQSVLVSGESGSGKTENTKYMLKFLCNNYSDNNLLSDKIINCNYLIELFGNAKTQRNDNSSRFGKFIKLYVYNKKIIGANISSYLLEKSRISSIDKLEKTYHIFYLLTEKYNQLSEYGLEKSQDYRILRESNYNHNIDEFSDLNRFFSVMEQFNFTKQEQSLVIFKIQLILKLLDVTCKEDLVNFIDNSTDLLDKLLINKDDIWCILTQKCITTRNETIVKELAEAEILVKIRTHVEDIYENIFTDIIDKISSNLDKTCDTYISILDIFGFEVFESNGFEQLCINYTNEVLQQIFNEYIFRSEQLEYERENLNWKFIDYQHNDELVKIFSSNLSIFSIINEQSILGSGSDQTIFNNFEKTLTSDKFSVSDMNRPIKTFTIKHFTGNVDYTVTNYIKKNRKSGKCSKEKTTLQYFTKQLGELKDELNHNNCYFIRCIKPNDRNISDTFEQKKIYKQLLYSGVIEGIKIVLKGYPVKKDLHEIINEFRFFEYYNNHSIIEYLSRSNYTKKEYQVGKTKIFMKKDLYDKYYRINNECKSKLATIIQSHIRRFIAIKNYFYTLYKIIVVQSMIRMKIATKKVHLIRLTHNCIIIQSKIRTFICEKSYRKYVSAKKLQQNVRMFINKKKYQMYIADKKNNASRIIALLFRRHRINRRIEKRNRIHSLNLIIEKTEIELNSNKKELHDNKLELNETKEIVSKQQDEIAKLKQQILKMEENSKSISQFIKNRKKLEFKETVRPENHSYINDLSESIHESDSESSLSGSNENLKEKIVNDFFKEPSQSDTESDEDLSLTEKNIQSIRENNLEELGSKMEKLYTELQESKQSVSSMQMEYGALLRAYQSEKHKKTFWGVVESLIGSKISK